MIDMQTSDHKISQQFRFRIKNLWLCNRRSIGALKKEFFVIFKKDVFDNITIFGGILPEYFFKNFAFFCSFEEKIKKLSRPVALFDNSRNFHACLAQVIEGSKLHYMNYLCFHILDNM